VLHACKSVLVMHTALDGRWSGAQGVLRRIRAAGRRSVPGTDSGPGLLRAGHVRTARVPPRRSYVFPQHRGSTRLGAVRFRHRRRKERMIRRCLVQWAGLLTPAALGVPAVEREVLRMFHEQARICTPYSQSPRRRS
jgi:hypothetical protein